MTEKEKSHAGLLYLPSDAELTADREVTQRKLYDYNHIHPLDRDARQTAIREILGQTGDGCCVEQPLFCTYGYNTTVGRNFFLNVNCKLMDSGKITIGDNVFIAPNVCIVTEEHSMNVEERAAGYEYTRPVCIGDNVWICTGAIILPGVTIGSGSVIGAGSVVTKDIPPNSVAVGVPCKVIRKNEENRTPPQQQGWNKPGRSPSHFQNHPTLYKKIVPDRKPFRSGTRVESRMIVTPPKLSSSRCA